MLTKLRCFFGFHRLAAVRRYWLLQIYKDGRADYTPSLWIQEWECVWCRGTRWG